MSPPPLPLALVPTARPSSSPALRGSGCGLGPGGERRRSVSAGPGGLRTRRPDFTPGRRGRQEEMRGGAQPSPDPWGSPPNLPTPAQETTAGRRGHSRPGLQTLGSARAAPPRRPQTAASKRPRRAPLGSEQSGFHSQRRGRLQIQGRCGFRGTFPGPGMVPAGGLDFQARARGGGGGLGWGSPSDECLLLSFAQRRARVLCGRRSDGQLEELSPRRVGAAAV